jgi:hypothetical protein
MSRKRAWEIGAAAALLSITVMLTPGAVNTALRDAASRGDSSRVRFLLRVGPGSGRGVSGAPGGDSSRVRFLLRVGANPESRDARGERALEKLHRWRDNQLRWRPEALQSLSDPGSPRISRSNFYRAVQDMQYRFEQAYDMSHRIADLLGQED